MSVRFVGPYQVMGPVAVDSSATISKGDFVQINAAGAAEAIAAKDATNLAVALDKYPDTEYEGTKSMIEVARLGEDVVLEVPIFTSSTVSAAILGSTSKFWVTATGQINVDVESATLGVFHVVGLSRDTSFGDSSGYLRVVVDDSAAW